MNFYHRKRTTQLTKLSIDLCCPIPPWYLVQHSCCDSVSGGLTSCMAHLFPLYLLSYKKKFKKFRSLLYLSFTRYLLNRIFQRKKQTGRRRRKREGSDYICAVLLLLYMPSRRCHLSQRGRDRSRAVVSECARHLTCEVSMRGGSALPNRRDGAIQHTAKELEKPVRT